MSQEHKDVRQRLARLTAAQRSLLANRLGTAKSEARGRFAPPLVKVDRGRALPASWSQQRLWFLQQLDPAAGAAYHIPTGLRLQGELHRDALLAALGALVARHEVLRTSFVVHDEPMQQIAPADTGFHLIEHDLSGLPAAIRRRRIEEISAGEAGEPFDLSLGPLIRGQLLRLGPEDHLLLITQHHIVSDGWSTGVMLREIAAFYGAYDQGLPCPLPALHIQYADYAVWQRQWLQGEVLEAQMAFWRSHLASAPDMLVLPTDRPRAAKQSYAGARVELKLPGALVAQLRDLSQRHEVTLFMTLLAGWSACLSRLGGQTDLVIGAPVANRRRSELEPLIGFFANTLALRVRLDGNPSVADLLARIKHNTLQAYANQDIPFAQVVEVLQPRRSLSYNPIFQVVLAFDNAPGERVLSLPDLSVTKFDLPLTGAKFDLSLSMRDSGETIEGVLEYATDLFDRATIERMSDQLISLLQSMVADERQRIDALNLSTAGQREQLLVQFNDTHAAYAAGQCVHELFEAHAAATPQAIAVVYEEQQITYARLNACANAVAHRLLALRVRPDDRVAICLERSLEMVVALLAVSKAGGAYVPLDPSLPRERLAYMLADSTPVALLTGSTARENLPSVDMPIVELDLQNPFSCINAEPGRNPGSAGLALRSTHLAYVIYTSGSTGLPKGVMVQHASLVNILTAMAREPGLSAEDVLLAVTTLSFDIAGLELFLPLAVGARVVLASRAATVDPSALTGLIRRHAVTVMQATPATWRLLLSAASPCRSA